MPDDSDIMLANIISFYEAGMRDEAYQMLQEMSEDSPVRHKTDKWMERLEEEFQYRELMESYDDW